MIRALSDYTEGELHLLCSSSPAAHQYIKFLHSPFAQGPFQALHKNRLTAWLESVLATFFSSASPREICSYWSNQADLSISEVAQACDFSNLGLAIFAMGKLGAQELNLSSDIDLILFSNEEPNENMIRAVRKFIKILSTPVEGGVGFRVDLDLRPGGKGSPLVCHLKRMRDYYWTQAELWERMALVRLRAICGPSELSSEILETRDHFCYRKYLDYSLLEELKRLRPKIHSSAKQKSQYNHINLKLDPGFIRDIELFINAHQIIYGGKEKSLRTTSTEMAAHALRPFEKKNGLFTQLLHHYWEYRQWENQIQSIQDSHSHEFNPQSPPSGWSWPSQITLQAMSHFVDDNITDLLGPATATDSISHKDFDESDLKRLGFSEHSIQQVWPEVLKASVLSRQKEVDETKRQEVIKKFITEISESAFDKDLGLKGLKDFLNSIRAKATFFHLLAKEKGLVKDLSFLFGLSPYLGSLFSNRPELVDSFLFNRDEPFTHDLESAIVQMAERKSLAEIRSALAFLGKLNVQELTLGLSETADLITDHLLNLVQQETQVESVDVLALGKWGGHELGFKSDLDFIFVSPQKPSEDHFRLARRFISRMRDSSSGGSLYNIDTRLRPFQKGGALIIDESQLEDFLRNRASSWERQAYLKGRFLRKIKSFPFDEIIQKGVSSEELEELRNIREKLILPLRQPSFSLKMSAGGLLDIELFLQTSLLHQKIEPKGTSTLDFFTALKMENSSLAHHYDKIRILEQVIKILSAEADPILSLEKSYMDLAARIMKKSKEELHYDLHEGMQEASHLIRKCDPIFC